MVTGQSEERAHFVVINAGNELQHFCNLSKIQAKVKMNPCCCLIRLDMNLFMLDCGGEFSRTDLGEGWQGIRNPAGAKFSFSPWNDVSSPLLAPLTTIHPQQMLTKTTIATGSSAPEIYRIHHLDTYCVKSHSLPTSSIVHKDDIKILL